MKPSPWSMWPSPFWSMPRPPAGKLTEVESVNVSVYLLAGPKPFPGASIAIVAIPYSASLAATSPLAASFDELPPAKMATG